MLANFIHARGCKPICAKLLTLPLCEPLIELYLVGSLVLEPILRTLKSYSRKRSFFRQTVLQFMPETDSRESSALSYNVLLKLQPSNKSFEFTSESKYPINNLIHQHVVVGMIFEVQSRNLV